MAAEVAVEERGSKGWVGAAVYKDEEIVGGGGQGLGRGRRNPLGAIIGFTASVGLVPSLSRRPSVPFILSKLVKIATNIFTIVKTTDFTFPPIDENV